MHWKLWEGKATLHIVAPQSLFHISSSINAVHQELS